MSESIKSTGQYLHNYESSLCFPKDVFYAKNFDVDAFVSHYKKEYSLERLRDDLAIFLKVLEMSMSDLINKDYPDFVNLSTNLVDLEKVINDLKNPLDSIKSDVDSVRNSLDTEIGQIMSKLNEKLLIEKRRIVLKLLMNWQRSLKVTNEMIGNPNASQKINGDHVQRIAFEFCQLKNSLSICAGEDKSTILTQDIDKLSQVLENIMRDLFIDCVTNWHKISFSDNKHQLKHVLKSYSLLGKEKHAEQLYTQYVVEPYLDQFINEEYLQNNIHKLDGVYEKILDLMDSQEEFFLIVSQIHNSGSNEENKNNHSAKIINNSFDFLINSVWSCILSKIEYDMSSIFSASDADLFHQNFKQSFDFIAKFESKCHKIDKNFHINFNQSQSFKYFTKKWPIQVYYQIRFQEIVYQFESDLINYSHTNPDKPDNLCLNITESLLKKIDFIWSEQTCFLKCLLPQFWRLNLQIINRYTSFYNSLTRSKIEQLDKAESQVDFSSDLDTIFNILHDLHQLYEFKLPNVFDGVIAPVIRACSQNVPISSLKEAFNFSIQMLKELEVFLIDFVSKTIIQKCLVQLRSAIDIPRLYRRTNRNRPENSLQYVNDAVGSIRSFKATYSGKDKSDEQNEIVKKCVLNIVDSVCISYQSIASDLLDSVRKMEDSLKKLQRVKQKNKLSNSLAHSNLVSDDDKIRIQIYLDIVKFGQLLESEFGSKGESNYESLFKLVEPYAILKQDNNSNQQAIDEKNETNLI
ncbi:conserved oligomeric Golgi complex subunit 2 isoform X1 [Brachionus plicatilis]|uniref:Conserved oligomeric Golgi complex subunit 2 n=1 Tax=Brachionus plicatilis TaxID=10195 RepID=A0A3M7R8H3_BRAPC|nr:conserved oligomeric Golgi complex subunit 2 isoform X1 [Brachionus plicatilis]